MVFRSFRWCGVYVLRGSWLEGLLDNFNVVFKSVDTVWVLCDAEIFVFWNGKFSMLSGCL